MKDSWIKAIEAGVVFLACGAMHCQALEKGLHFWAFAHGCLGAVALFLFVWNLGKATEKNNRHE